MPTIPKSEPANRERWLTMLCDEHIWPHLVSKCDGRSFKQPKLWKVSLGFPKGSRGGKGGHAIGQCWSPEASAEGIIEVFVSPELDAKLATSTLVHELIHAGVGNGCGHKGPFVSAAKAAGLIGRMRSTTPGPDLARLVEHWLAVMPDYPHAVLQVPDGKKVGPGSRLLKVFCPDCGYTLRGAAKWLEIAVPKCPSPECEDSGLAMMLEGA